MPDGTRLKKAKLRGQVSNGMILAEDEVAIGTDHDGIMVLDEELAAGSPLADALPIATDVLELEITPNRPDCLAVYGVAREVHAATGAPLAPPPWADDPGTPGEVAGVRIEVEDPDLCPRFTARLFEDVTIGPSPPWLKARLMAAGQRPINNVVDITNFAMLLARASRCTPSTSTSWRAATSSSGARARGRRSPRSTTSSAGWTPTSCSSATTRGRPASPASWAASAPRCARPPRAC